MAKLAASVGALAVAVLGVTACTGGGPAVRVTAEAQVSVAGVGSPLAGAQAFSGQGRLAFVSGKRLYVLDGSAAGRPAALHAVSTGKGPGSPGSPAWSLDGRQLAVAVVNLTAQKRFVSSAIDVFVSSDGIAATAIGFSRSDALVIDGWWADGQGLLAWSDPHGSASLAANGLPLVSYPLAGEPAPVASTLVYPSFAVPGANGVTLVTGGDRYLWSAKTIRQCTVSAHCGFAMNARSPSPAQARAWPRPPGRPTPVTSSTSATTPSG